MRIVGQGAEFVAFVLFARRLGSSDFGLLWAGLLVARYAGLVADWGAILRGSRDVARAAWSEVTALLRRRRAVGVLLTIAYAGVAAIVQPWLVPLALVVLNRGVGRDWIAVGREQGWRAGVPSALQGTLLAIAAAAVTTRESAAIVTAVAYGIALIASIALNRFPRDVPAGHVRTDGWLLGGSLGDQVSATADVLILTSVRGPSEAGIYAAAYRIPNAWNTALGLMVSGLVPVVTTTLHDDPAKLPYLVRRTLVRSGLVSVALVVAAPAIALSLTPIFGSEYSSGRTAATILLLAMGAATFGAPLHAFYLARGSDHLYAAALMGAGACNLAANAVLIPVAGRNGAAFATLFSVSALQVMLLLLVRREIRRVVDQPASPR
jgi:O-antigen/teichoic acid export membrane protein